MIRMDLALMCVAQYAEDRVYKAQVRRVCELEARAVMSVNRRLLQVWRSSVLIKCTMAHRAVKA